MPAIELFSPPVREWFLEEVGTPTRTQEMGWPHLAAGRDALVCAPTGTGKTLCAFLLSIDRLLRQAEEGTLDEGVRVLYISPLKALGNDIARNLDMPLKGIAKRAPKALEIQKAIRTGDTSTGDRRRMASHPPHILITTPESLYLLLTSQAGQHMFAKLETVIVDEVHAILESKRGTHLTLSLERLRFLHPFQRIGLTATVEPLPEAANFLGGVDNNVQIVDARTKKAMNVTIECPAESFNLLPEGTVWPEIAKTVYNHAKSHTQTLVFCNGRMPVENVTSGVNKEADIETFAAAHHGSMDKERRLQTELRFKSGELRCLVATSSMELGIDVGAIDLVIQVASPRSAARGLQRLGRSGHRPGDTSKMAVLPRMAQDALESALVVRGMLNGSVEPTYMPRLCLDVLAQHIVSMGCQRTWKVQEIYDVARRAYPYKDLTMEDLISVLCMMRGDFEHRLGRDFRPRIQWNENEGTVSTDNYGRMLAVGGSTIPDRGLYPVVTPEGVRLGELDEQFVYEARVGDRFRLGAFPWAITRIQHDRVVVVPTDGQARIPFWTGDGLGRPSQTGEEFGREMAMLEQASNLLREIHARYPVDDAIARSISSLLHDQIEAIGCLPTDKRIVVEQFKDESGECLIAVHCMLGGRVNQALAMIFREAAYRITKRDAQAYHSDDGVLLHLTGEDNAPKGMLQDVDPETVRPLLIRELPSTTRFMISFRQAAAVALQFSGRKAGQRVPLWVQRLRGAEALSRAAESFDHPLIVEAYRECLDREMEVDRVIQLFRDIRSGAVEVVEVQSASASPLTRELKASLMEEFVYYEAEPKDVAIRGALASEDTIAPPQSEMRRELGVQEKSADKLYSQLLKRGSLTRHECGNAIPFADELIREGRANWFNDLLIASHETTLFSQGLEGDLQARKSFVMRFVRAAGEVDEHCDRFGVDITDALEELADEGELTSYRRKETLYYAPVEAAQQAIAAAARERRAQVKTQPGTHYAALLPVWQKATGELPSSRLIEAIRPLFGLYLDRLAWESAVLPLRMALYKPRDLDQLLLTGEIIWRVKDGKVAFFPADQPCLPPVEADDLVYRTLLTGGALFQRQIAQKFGVAGAELQKRLNDLVLEGLIACDGFRPLRELRMPDDPKHRVKARASALSSEGRWEAAGIIAPVPVEEKLEQMFDRWAIVGKECAAVEGVPWGMLMEALRGMEYRDEVRRGYFVEGMSGAQFVRTRQYERIRLMLENPEGVYVLPANDPAQAYGSLLPGAGFTCVAGTAVAMLAGRPVLAAERRGEQLRALVDISDFTAPVQALAEAFGKKRLWPERMRLTCKSWPDGSADAMKEAGYRSEMLDLTLWRSSP